MGSAVYWKSGAESNHCSLTVTLINFLIHLFADIWTVEFSS